MVDSLGAEDIGRELKLKSPGKIVKSAVQTSFKRPGAENRKTLAGPYQFLSSTRRADEDLL